jgi:protoporphyrinogen oxidase
MKTIIIGAGLSGLSLAYHLEKKGEKDYILLESSLEVGGLCKSIRKEGFTFDFGPHMLHLRDNEIIELVKELLKDELTWNNRKAGILLEGKIIPYPFQYNLYHLNEKIRAECLNNAIEVHNTKTETNNLPKNFDEWIKMNLGEGIARWFMRPYNRKCFCVDTKELTLDFLGRHVPSPSLEEIKQGATSDMSNAKVGYYNQFYYTKKGGIDFLPKSFAKKVNNIHLGEKVVKIDLNRKILFTDKSNHHFVNLVSTIPLTNFIPLIEDVPEKIKITIKNIRFNKVCAVLLGIDKPKLSDYNFLYFPQEDILPYRISFPMNSSKEMTPTNMSSICAEYSYLEEKKLTDNEIIDKTINDLVRIGIINDKRDVIFKDILELNPAYAIFDFYRSNNLKLVIDYLDKNGIYTIGPFGKCEHMSMEDSIIAGKEIAEKIYTF